jgi:hypothetical protein
LNTGKNADAGLTFFRHSGIYSTSKGIYFSTTSSVDLRLFLFPEYTVNSLDVRVYLFRQQQGVNLRVYNVGVRVYSFPLAAGVEVRV